MVQPTFGWLKRQRRLVRDDETTDTSAEAWIYIQLSLYLPSKLVYLFKYFAAAKKFHSKAESFTVGVSHNSSTFSFELVDRFTPENDYRMIPIIGRFHLLIGQSGLLSTSSGSPRRSFIWLFQ